MPTPTQPTPPAIAGIDAGKTHAAAIIPTSAFASAFENNGKRAAWRTAGEELKITNTRADYEALLRAMPPATPIFIEPLGYYITALVAYLTERDHPVYYVPGNTTKAARPALHITSSNDRIDARTIAAIGWLHLTTGQYPCRLASTRTDLDTYILSMARQLDQATRECTRAINRCRQLMHAIAPEIEELTPNLLGAPTDRRPHEPRPNLLAAYPDPRDLAALPEDVLKHNFATKAARDKLRAEAATTIGSRSTYLQIALAAQANAYSNHLAQRLTALRLLEQAAREHPLHQLLATIPSTTDATIAVLAGVISDINNFESKTQLRVALGTYTHRHTSGTSVDEAKSGQKGNRLAKRAIYLLAMSLINRKRGAIYETYQRRKSAGRDHNIANARRQIADRIYAMLTTGQPWNDSLKPEEENETQSTTQETNHPTAYTYRPHTGPTPQATQAETLTE